MTRALGAFLYRRGHWHDWAAAGRAAVAAAHRLADPSAQARAHRTLAGAYVRLGRFDDAHIHLGHALDLATQTGDQTGQAHTHLRLSHLGWERRGGYPQALDHARQALDLFQAAGDQIGQARALNTVGWFHAQLGEYQQALTACQQSLTLHQDLNDRYGQANTWDGLGYTHHLGHHTQAITSYQHAITLFRYLGDRYHEADSLTRLGDTHHVTGNPPAARDAWQQALAILDDLHHPNADQLRTKLAGLDTRPNPTNDD